MATHLLQPLESRMDETAYLEELRSLIGGEIEAEQLALGSLPRLYANPRGHFVKLDFVVRGEIVLEVNTRPPHHLRLRKEGAITRALGRLRVLPDHKTGDPTFDDRYIIDNASQEQVTRLLTPEARSLITSLEPFALFELTQKEYRCLKDVRRLEDYPPERAAADLNTMIDLAELVARTVGPGKAPE